MSGGGWKLDVMQRRRVLIGMQWQDQPPPFYMWIDYAESDGNAYVELPFGFDKTDVVEMYCAILDGTSDKFLASPKTWNNDTNRYAMCGHNNSGGVNRFGVGFGGVGTGTSRFRVLYDTDFHTWTYKELVFRIIDLNALLDVSSYTWGARTNNIRLFYGHNNPTKGKISFYKQTTSTDGVKHLIRPIKHISTGVVEMYDVATKSIMPRTGTLYPPT